MEMSKAKESASLNAQGAVAPPHKANNKVIAAMQAGSMVGLKSKDVQSMLGSYKSQMEDLLKGSIITPERMIAMAATEVTKNPNLLKCTPSSFCGAVLQASILGFQPVAALGYCYFVPYKNEIQFQIGYKGYLALARRSGEVKSIYAEVVREGDKFEYCLGLHRDLVHEPCGSYSNEITHSYAVVEYKDGGVQFVVLSRAEIERLRKRSPMQNSTPTGAWATDYEAMAKAKALKQLSKYMPLNVDTVNAIHTDGAVIKAENIEGNEVKVEDIAFTEVDEDGVVIDNQSEEPANANQQ